MLEGEKLKEGKTISAEERQFDVLVVNDFAVAKRTVEVFLGLWITDPSINVWISSFDGHSLNALARGGRRCHDRGFVGTR
ncbi:hypothetical protein DEO72_LG2g3779 [Vigna unguiculata]|uniref:Uncharacterized protein n=1 Tax=Vigna unguiculata TaxID=3917 RepID=A0A4D6L4P9_VIGUN|nr:hypothetical protein DEO72_LG2g3779 [Vigna unguiculata]